MTYGLTCLNDSGELTIAADGYLFGYLGKATYVSTTPPGTSTSDSFAGFSTYTFSWGAPIVVSVGLVANQPTHVMEFSNSGSTWTIRVFHGNNSSNSLGFDVQATSTDVYVFGLPTTLPAYGMAFYDGSGNLVGDLSRQPLLFKQRVTMGAGVTTMTMTGYTKPAVLGYAEMDKTTSVLSGVTHQNRLFGGTWYWNTSTGKLERNYFQNEYFQDDAGIAITTNVYASDAVLIEAIGLT